MSRKRISNLLIGIGAAIVVAGIALALDLPSRIAGDDAEAEPEVVQIDAAATFRGIQAASAARMDRLMHSRLVLGVPRKKLESIAECESHGNPRSIGGGGLYRGKYQFDRQTWHSIGGKGDPAKATELEQDQRAAALYKERGSSPWPVCG